MEFRTRNRRSHTQKRFTFLKKIITRATSAKYDKIAIFRPCEFSMFTWAGLGMLLFVSHVIYVIHLPREVVIINYYETSD